MKPTLLALLVLPLLVLFACQKQDNRAGGLAQVQVQLNLSTQDRSGQQQAVNAAAGSALIKAVNASVTSVRNDSQVPTLNQAMLDLASNQVNLTLPLNKPIRLVKSVFQGVYGLNAASMQKVSDRIGLSAPFTLSATDTQKNITIVIYGAPSVSAVQPADASTQMPVAAPLVITFSNPMDIASLTTNSTSTACSSKIQLSDNNFATCLPLKPAVSQGALGTRFSFRPSAPLAYVHNYSLKIAKGAADLVGNKSTQDFLSSFTTVTPTPSNPVILINKGAASTVFQSVNVGLSAKDPTGISAVYVSESPAAPLASAAGWKAVTAATNYTGIHSYTFLSGSAETKTLYAWFKNSYGHVSATASDQINHNLAEGSKDLSFASQGWVTHGNAAGGGIGDHGVGLVLHNKGVTVTGDSGAVGQGTHMVTWRYNEKGTLVPLYGNQGVYVDTLVSPVITKASGLDLAGNLLVGGSGPNPVVPTPPGAALWQITPAGALTSGTAGFGVVFQTNQAIGGGANTIEDLLVEPNGKIVAAGSSTDANFNTSYSLWRFNPDGTPDTTFGAGGQATATLTGISSVILRSIKRDAAGNYLTAGVGFLSLTTDDILVCRFTPTGALDTTFQGTGCLTKDGGNPQGLPYDAAYDLWLNPDGSFFVAGYLTLGANSIQGMAVLKYTATGVLDTSFNAPKGYVFYNNTPAGAIALNTDMATKMAVDDAGNLVVVGNSAASTTFAGVILRYTPAGQLDTGFNQTGKIILANLAGTGPVRLENLQIDPLGRIYATGNAFVTASGNQDMLLIRLK